MANKLRVTRFIRRRRYVPKWVVRVLWKLLFAEHITGVAEWNYGVDFDWMSCPILEKVNDGK